MRFEVDGVKHALAFRYETAETGKSEWRTLIPGGRTFDGCPTRSQVLEPITRRLVHAILYREEYREALLATVRTELARGTVRVNQKLGFVKETLRREALDALQQVYGPRELCDMPRCPVPQCRIMRAARKAYDERPRGEMDYREYQKAREASKKLVAREVAIQRFAGPAANEAGCYREPARLASEPTYFAYSDGGSSIVLPSAPNRRGLRVVTPEGHFLVNTDLSDNIQKWSRIDTDAPVPSVEAYERALDELGVRHVDLRRGPSTRGDAESAYSSVGFEENHFQFTHVARGGYWRQRKWVPLEWKKWKE
jgi:hypothetical protein